MTRSAQVARTTNETDISLSLALDGDGSGARTTGVGFFDHLLDALARHGRLDLDVKVEGDLQTGPHHTVEDTGIAIGRALDEALGDRSGIRRYGSAVVPMDEARASCAIDVSGRPFAAFEGGPSRGGRRRLRRRPRRGVLPRGRRHGQAHRCTSPSSAGTNTHHMVEAAFKAFARALREAVSIDPDEAGIPSTKGLL